MRDLLKIWLEATGGDPDAFLTTANPADVSIEYRGCPMSASVPVYVRVLKTHTEVIRISAITTDEAEAAVYHIPDVVRVLGSSYQEPENGEYEEYKE